MYILKFIDDDVDDGRIASNHELTVYNERGMKVWQRLAIPKNRQLITDPTMDKGVDMCELEVSSATWADVS